MLLFLKQKMKKTTTKNFKLGAKCSKKVAVVAAGGSQKELAVGSGSERRTDLVAAEAVGSS